jgi:AraC-like DNA-binding protein
MIGHTWSHRAGISPLIVAAKELVTNRRWTGSIDRKPYWILDYVISPFGRFRVGSERAAWMQRAAGTLILYPPNMLFGEDTSGVRGTLHCAWILFAGGEQAGLEPFVRPRGYAVFNDDDGIMRDTIVAAATESHRYGERAFWAAQEILIRALGILFNAKSLGDGCYRIGAGADRAGESDFVNRTELVLKQHLLEKVPLAHIAGHLSMSASGFSHRFKRETGATPCNVANAMKIEHAKALLFRGQPLKIIADELGFCDEFHLSKSFKRIEGVAPREFLRRSRAPDRG